MAHRRTLRYGLVPLLAGCLLLASALLRPPPTITLTLGQEADLNVQGEARNVYNLLGWGRPEMQGAAGLQRSARRAGERASFVIPLAFRLADRLTLTVTSCGCGISDAAYLTLNDSAEQPAPPIPLTMTDDWRTQQIQLAHRPSLHGDDVYLAWHSTGDLGPLVHRVQVAPTDPPVPWLAAGVLALTVAGVLWLGRHEPQRALLPWLALVVGSALLGDWLYQRQLLPWPVLLASGGVAALLLTRLVGGWQRLALWALALWVLAVPQLFGTWILDDAYISFRYARNLIAGHGLTFNPGGAVVEGYTNFLWTLAIAGGLVLNFEPALLAQATTLLLALVCLLVCFLLARRWFAPPAPHPLPLLATGLLALNPAFLTYSARGSGMETALVTLLALLALWAIWRAGSLVQGGLAGLLCALVVMTRPDGALVPLAGGLYLLAQVARSVGAERRRWLWVLAGLVGGFGLLYGPYFLWRFSYYGYLLPNTFYAKTGATSAQVVRGLRYSLNYWQTLGLAGVLVLLAWSGWALVGRRWRERVPAGPAPLLWLFLLLQVLYVVAVGGDQFPLGRFFVPAMPPLALLLAHGLAAAWRWQASDRQPRRWWRWLARGSAVLAVALLVGKALLLLPTTDSRLLSSDVWRENKVALKNAEYGHWLRQHTPPDATVATGIAGALPYYAERHVLDMLGLNDVYIAHLTIDTMGQGIAGAEKTDVAYVLNQQPHYIPLSTSGNLLGVPRFEQTYRLVDVPGPRGGILKFYVLCAIVTDRTTCNAEHTTR